jgi:hypothetical protein
MARGLAEGVPLVNRVLDRQSQAVLEPESRATS